MEKDVQEIYNLKFNFDRKKVGIYCRVSSNSGSQLHSLADQASGLIKNVYRRPDMAMADIFLDVASGADVIKRPEFQRMLQSAQQGDINYVITKAVSRFGRCTEDVLKATRALKEYGVEVFFDDQQFGSLEPEAELSISIYCSIAEAENKSHSADVRWGILHHAQDGTSRLYNKPCYGYRQNDSGELEIFEREAAIVRRIYAMYLSGMSIVKIKYALEQDGVSSPTGKEQWSKHTIDYILSNTKYSGTAMIYKTYTPEYKSKRRLNDSKVNQYALADNNEPIIPEDYFKQVQAERARRSNIEILADGSKKRKSIKYSSKRST